MNIKKILISLLCSLTLVSCGGVDFVYNNPANLTNSLYDKTSYKFSGKDLPTANKYASIYFGKNISPEFSLEINISEDKTKKSVQQNQAVSKIDYKLTFNYTLSKVSGCLVYNKLIYSRFSYVPKSDGYNFGSDESLKKLYELSIEENLTKFLDFVSNVNLTTCLNEN